MVVKKKNLENWLNNSCEVPTIQLLKESHSKTNWNCLNQYWTIIYWACVNYVCKHVLVVHCGRNFKILSNNYKAFVHSDIWLIEIWIKPLMICLINSTANSAQLASAGHSDPDSKKKCPKNRICLKMYHRLPFIYHRSLKSTFMCKIAIF